MAVYTQVSDAALAEFLTDYDIGEAQSFKGIAEGVENSNYFLETTTGKYILTLFEKRVNAADLPYFVELKRHLAGAGFPCPQPIAGNDGDCLRSLEGRPALIVSFLNGLSVKSPNKAQCFELGKAMAMMHAALKDFELSRQNDLGPSDWPKLWQGRADTANSLRARLSGDIDADLAAIAAAKPLEFQLPRGTIHADLFPDNVFFSGDTFSGVIDFYFSCTDALAYDVAVCLNAWAFNDMGSYDLQKGKALLDGYQDIRKLEPEELDALPVLARGAALRFFLTRLVDWTDTPTDALVKPKDPLEYARKLDWHRSLGLMASSYGA